MCLFTGLFVVFVVNLLVTVQSVSAYLLSPEHLLHISPQAYATLGGLRADRGHQ